MESSETKLSHSPQSSVYNVSTSPTAQPKRRTSRPGTRVSHSKSRKGCVTCKRKKVKCDEQRPSCFNCTRLQVECRYILLPLKKSPIVPKELPKAIPESINGINFVDLELLYVYTTSTYSTLSTSSTLRQFWRVTVPQLAIQNRYLMGEVLALAALHLAYYRSAQRNYYLSIALNHHQAASQRATELLENVTKENSDGLFVFSLLTLVTSIVPRLSRLARFHRLILLAMATPKRSSSNDIPTEEGDFEDWIYLIQGTKELRGTLGEECSSSPLAPLFTFGSERWNLHYSMHSATGRCSDMLFELQTRMRTSVHDLDKLDIYNERISSLQSAACHAFDWEGTDVFFWLYGCIDGFLPLVKARNQEAWVILAYFSVTLKKAEAQWWLQGWADCIMRKVYEQLDGEHKHWIARAIEEIGWIA